MVYGDSRLSKHGGLITYIYDTFSLERLSDVAYNPNSTVYESMFLKIHNKTSKFTKYIIGNIYRRPSSILVVRNTNFIGSGNPQQTLMNIKECRSI